MRAWGSDTTTTTTNNQQHPPPEPAPLPAPPAVPPPHLTPSHSHQHPIPTPFCFCKGKAQTNGAAVMAIVSASSDYLCESLAATGNWNLCLQHLNFKVAGRAMTCSQQWRLKHSGSLLGIRLTSRDSVASKLSLLMVDPSFPLNLQTLFPKHCTNGCFLSP